MINFLVNQTPFLYLIQSLWRDEAFSVLIAQNSTWDIIKLTSGDFNPPLYYLILHYWMLIFGNSEISIRVLSFIFYLILIYIFYKFAKKFFKSKFLLFSLLFLIFFNPMLVYYSLEARMYSLLALLSVLSMYYFYQIFLAGKKENTKQYILFTILGLYTQPFMIFVIIAQAVYLFFFDKLGKFLNFLKKLSIVFLFYFPWIFIIFNQFKQTKQIWIYPVDSKLVFSVLGNLYLGYEGTPFWLWKWTKLLSVMLMLLMLLPLLKRKIKKELSLFYLWLFLPLILVIGFSFLKPVFVNRYLIYTTVPMIFLIIFGVSSIRMKTLRNLISVLFLLFTFLFNFWFASYHKKIDFRSTFLEVNLQLTENSIVVSETPLSFFEANYYIKERSRVFLYNPKGQEIPSFLGSVIIPKTKWINSFPENHEVFLIYNNGTYTKIKS